MEDDLISLLDSDGESSFSGELSGISGGSEDILAQYSHDVTKVKPIWDGEIRCPQFHKLTYRSSKEFWDCDISTFNPVWPRSHYEKHSKKTQYGLKESEDWNCLTRKARGGNFDNVPVYECVECDFDICLPCYQRAQRGMERMRIVTEALNNAKKVEWMQSKLMVVGEGRSGKTSTVRTLLGEGLVKGLASTVGADLRHARVRQDTHWSALSAEQRKNHALKAAAQEANKLVPKEEESVEFGEMQSSESIKGEGESEGEGEGSTKGEVQRVKEEIGGGKGNVERKVVKRLEEEEKEEEEDGVVEVAEIAGEFNLDLLSTAEQDLDAVKFTIWDFGGQRVFYSLHHLFLTQYGVYLVVFSLSSFAKNKAESMEYLEYWLNSIRLHARQAPVILIGTHVDTFRFRRTAAVKKINKELGPLLSKFKQIERNPQEQLRFFPLSNKTGDGIVEIRKQIETASQRQEFLHLKVSIRWLRTLDVLTANTARSWVGLKNVNEVARKCGVENEDEVGLMLKLFHELGVLLHFTSTTALEQIVITNPQFVIDKIGKVIRDPALHKLDKAEIRQAGVEEEVKNLQEDGIASLDLLHYFWGRQFSPFFIDLMRRTLLMSDWPFNSGKDQHFLIPSLLPKRFIKAPEGFECEFQFGEGQLPEGCFSRVVCLCLDYSARQEGAKAPAIGRLSAKLSMDEEDATITLLQNGDNITLISSHEKKASKDAFIVDRMISKVNEDVMGAGLRWKVSYLDRQTGKSLSQPEAKKAKLAPWFAEESPQLLDAVRLQPRSNLEAFMGALA